MKRNKILEWLGFRFIVNHNSGEVHRVDNLQTNCNIEAMTNAGYCTKFRVKKLYKRNEKYNGCAKCNKSEDTDLKKK